VFGVNPVIPAEACDGEENAGVLLATSEPYAVVSPYSNVTAVIKKLGFTVAIRPAVL
jgi:hypothetical protein